MPPFNPKLIALAFFATVLTDQSVRTQLKAVPRGNMIALGKVIAQNLNLDPVLDEAQTRQVADIMTTLGETTQGKFLTLFNAEVQSLIFHPH